MILIIMQCFKIILTVATYSMTFVSLKISYKAICVHYKMLILLLDIFAYACKYLPIPPVLP